MPAARDYWLPRRVSPQRRPSARIRQVGGFAFSGDVDAFTSAILAGCDGRHSLGELVTGLAHGANMDVAAFVPACISVVRKLMQLGFLSAANFSP